MVFSFASDGRAYTDYKSNCSVNQKIMQEKKLTGNEYRLYLQKNATKLIEQERADAQKKFK